MSRTSDVTEHPDHPACLARSVVDALSKEPSLEAVTINLGEKKIFVATLGKADVPKLTENVASQIRSAYEQGVSEHCLLLEGKGDCRTCEAPLPKSERKRITIEHKGDVTTIARVTCPTAPKFWRWRDLPSPEVVPRGVRNSSKKPSTLTNTSMNGSRNWRRQLLAVFAVWPGIFCTGRTCRVIRWWHLLPPISRAVGTR